MPHGRHPLTKLNKAVFKREQTQTCLEFAERKQPRPKVKYSMIIHCTKNHYCA